MDYSEFFERATERLRELVSASVAEVLHGRANRRQSSDAVLVPA